MIRYGTSTRPVGARIRLLKLVVYRFFKVRDNFRYSVVSTASAIFAKVRAVHSAGIFGPVPTESHQPWVTGTPSCFTHGNGFIPDKPVVFLLVARYDVIILVELPSTGLNAEGPVAKLDLWPLNP